MSTEPANPSRICVHCRGALRWDAAAGHLRCQGCGALQAVDDEGAIAEHDLEDALSQRKARGRLGAGARQVRCAECHAEVEVPDELQATACEFCASSLVLVQAAADDHFQPESLVPFCIDRAAAVQAFQTWLAGLWLRPSNLRAASSLKEMHGLYVPYWSFTCEVLSRWSADAGYTTLVKKRTREGVRRVPQTRWQPSAGQRHDAYQDHLVCASRGLAAEWSGPVHRFRTEALLPYSPEYLLGFAAERYAVDLREAWQRARRGIGSSQERRCAGDVPGDRQRGLRATHQFQRVRFKHVLLPLWISAYRYRDRVYRFVINGQTGQVAGQAPRSPIKIALLVGAVLLLVATIIWYLHYPR